MTVVQILDELLAPYSALGKPAIKKKLSNTYPTLEYTVQYRESDLAFATRLMERFGISYHFEHTDGNHALVMTDVMTAHNPLHGNKRKFQITTDGHRANEEHFWDMRPTRRMTTGGIRLTDYNFKTPMAAMEVDRMGDAAYAEGQIESYDYPGDYLEADQGKDVARLRTLQERGQDHRHRAIGDCTSLRAGMTVKVAGDKVKGVNDPCLCLSARHTFSTSAYASGQGDGDANYEGSYVLLPTSAPLAPERKTEIPRVQGPQTAVVVGDGEIDCDEYGRILVHFHWDLDKRYSMRCRVSQNWAGKGWGGMVIPRIGMEVVVEFLEGDPDRPLVTGCVYNGRNDVPYELPKHKTRSTFKTDTHQGSGFNELRFEDERGREEVYVHAQKDMNVGIERHETRHVGGNSHRQVSRNDSEIVAGLSAEYAGLGRMITAGGTVTIESGRVSPLAAMNADYFRDGGTVGFALTALMKDSDSLTAMRPGGVVVNASTDVAMQSGGEFTVGSMEGITFSAKDSFSAMAGDDLKLTSNQTMTHYAAGNMILASDNAMILRCGDAEILLKPDGDIEINGKKISINGESIWLN